MEDPHKITCQEAVELVTDYLENQLLPEIRMEFEQHIASCPGCTNYLHQMEQSIRLLRTLADDGIPAETQHKLLAAFRNSNNGNAVKTAPHHAADSPEDRRE
ncbi:MAG: zf-HC2 domain-containing protein [Chloroflexi bacterium]|nr:zf-HC2 domain-containing protein [Chloroflexota bacterium]